MNEELKRLLLSHDYDGLADNLEKAEHSAAAEFLSELDDDALSAVCRVLDSERLAEILVESPPETQARIIAHLPDRDLKEVMDEVSTEDTIEILEDIQESPIAHRIVEDDDIIRLTEEKKFSVLKPLLAQENAVDLALLFEKLPESDTAIIFRLLPKDLAAETFVEMNSELKKLLIASFSDLELKQIIDELFLDDTVDIIEEMPANVVSRIIAQSDTETRQYINELLNYPKDSAGSIMTIEFVYLKAAMTAKEAFAKIRKIGIDKETIYTCYVTDEKKKLIGVVTAKDLMLHEPQTLITDIMEENVIYVETHTDKEQVARMFSKYGFLALPVVDTERRLVGIVTFDDAINILQDEASEDIAIMGAVTPSDTPYLKTSVFKLWLNRAPWLLILMISATFTGMIITMNESTLAFSIYLTAAIPMLMDTGGNAGSQASVTVIRGIALNEIRFKDMAKVIWKESRVSILLGATLSVACFGKLMLIDRLWELGPEGYMIAFVICLAMFITIVIAKIIGCSLPLVAKACRLDPAVVASPFITTIVDALSLTIFCALAVGILV